MAATPGDPRTPFVGLVALSAARPRAASGPAQAASLPAAIHSMAAHDWLLLGQLLVLLALVLAGTGPTRGQAILLLSVDVVWFTTAVLWARSHASPSRLASGFYRLSLIALTIATYVELRWILPVIAPGSVDADLLALDLRVFRFEPALAWDRFVTPHTTEWFAFFYYSYFVILGIYALPIALGFEDGADLREFALGILTLYCVGHLTYVVVPALGPHVHVQEAFEHPLEGGVFWRLVKNAVEQAGAGKDVFPSLHTAAPLFLALYAFRHRARGVFRYVWPITAFFSSQIIVATMFLRWHYLVDIVAGIVLAVTVWLIVPHVVAWEARRRRTAGLPAVFSESPLRSSTPRLVGH